MHVLGRSFGTKPAGTVGNTRGTLGKLSSDSGADFFLKSNHDHVV